MTYKPNGYKISVKNKIYSEYMEEIQETERRNNTVIPQEDWMNGPEKVFEKWLYHEKW